MDPISVSASIIAVLGLTGTVIQCLNAVKDAPEDRKRILSELCGINSMLYTLQGKATEAQHDRSWSRTLHSLCMPNGPIMQFKIILERLAKRLEPSKGLKKVGAVITWPFQKGEVKELLNTLERQKTLFILAEQNDHL